MASRNCGIGLGTRAQRDFATEAESKIEMALALGVKGQPTYLFLDDHRSGMARNGLSALITQGTRRRGGCEEGADRSAGHEDDLDSDLKGQVMMAITFWKVVCGERCTENALDSCVTVLSHISREGVRWTEGTRSERQNQNPNGP